MNTYTSVLPVLLALLRVACQLYLSTTPRRLLIVCIGRTLALAFVARSNHC
jgi:hypothetical protein